MSLGNLVYPFRLVGGEGGEGRGGAGWRWLVSRLHQQSCPRSQSVQGIQQILSVSTFIFLPAQSTRLDCSAPCKIQPISLSLSLPHSGRSQPSLLLNAVSRSLLMLQYHNKTIEMIKQQPSGVTYNICFNIISDIIYIIHYTIQYSKSIIMDLKKVSILSRVKHLK